MKSVLVIAAAFSALAGAALAQPAWHPAEGGPPPGYPPCVAHHEDRCQQHWGGGYEGYGYGYHYRHGYRGRWMRQSYHGYYPAHRYHHHRHWGGHSSTDGERG